MRTTLAVVLTCVGLTPMSWSRCHAQMTNDITTEPAQAVREILAVTDYLDFLARSGYAERFSER